MKELILCFRLKSRSHHEFPPFSLIGQRALGFGEEDSKNTAEEDETKDLKICGATFVCKFMAKAWMFRQVMINIDG